MRAGMYAGGWWWAPRTQHGDNQMKPVCVWSRDTERLLGQHGDEGKTSSDGVGVGVGKKRGKKRR